MWTFHFKRSFFGCFQFNEKLKQLIESGITQRFIDSFYEFKFDLENSGPSILTLDQLNAGFLAWLYCLSISFLIFLLELILFYRKKIFEAISKVTHFSKAKAESEE